MLLLLMKKIQKEGILNKTQIFLKILSLQYMTSVMMIKLLWKNPYGLKETIEISVYVYY